ncbi:MAG: DUF362 domain-containing protein [Candidatus Geothermincolia bacterium]
MSIREELDRLELPHETDSYRVEREAGRPVALERRRDMVDPLARVFISEMGDSIPRDVGDAMERVGAARIIEPGQFVAVKVNLGGGIAGVPSSFSDPLVVEGVIDKARSLGGRPFICEANMRTLTMNQGLLARRAIYPLLARKDVEFVNLSELETIDFIPGGWSRAIRLPRALLHPSVRIVSVPALKHHWECGVTLAAKNMYGAIAERQKSLFHRGGAIDETVAAAARAVTPDISILAHRQVGAGLGPHFCVPLNFGYVIASDNVLAADRAGCDFMGTDWRRVKHLQVNCGGREVPVNLVEGSVPVDRLTRDRIARNAISPAEVWFWRAALYPQYFVPHGTQVRRIPRLEALGTWINWLAFHTRGDAWPSKWRPRWKPD